MTITQQRKVLQRMSEVENDIEELKRCRSEIAKNGYASATMSSGGGSKSYTHLDLSKITEAIAALTSELKQLRAMLTQGSQQSLWKNVTIVYS